jgi:hypothetical protein
LIFDKEVFESVSVRKRVDTETKQVIAQESILKSAIKKEELENFIEQAATVKNFSHPNITKLYELNQDQEHFHINAE